MEDESDNKKYSLIKDKVMNELLKFFRPELVNRFDEVIIFEPLKFIHMIEIVKLQLKGLAKLLEEQEMGFSATETAVKEIVRSGFDPIFGARPLRRAIQKLVENPISELIIAKKVQAGDTIIVDFNGEEFVFNVERIEKKEGTAKSGDSKQNDVEKMFFCEKCANTFTTVVKKNATPICSKCANKGVQEISDQSNQTVKDATSNKTEDKSLSGAGTKDLNMNSTKEPKKENTQSDVTAGGAPTNPQMNGAPNAGNQQMNTFS
jgi:ATP-dependent protease Clp ATPase subunit